MHEPFQFVGKERVLQVFGVRLVGVSAGNGEKLLVTVFFLIILVILYRLLRWLAQHLVKRRESHVRFWARQGIHIFIAALLILGLASIWFNDPARLASAGALITAGIAVALQRVITAISGYVVILRGKTFNVGDRIVMGGVRGDVVALGFIQTTIMEMGEPPSEQADAPAMWVAGRQYTGRVVTITNDKIFDNPVYNYTRDFPYIWDEMRLPVPYNADRGAAEQILLEVARKHTQELAEIGEAALKELERRYEVARSELEPGVYFRLTDNWLEMALRFVTRTHGVRQLKSAMSRDILDAFDKAGIGIASGTYDVVGVPELKVRITGADGQPALPQAKPSPSPSS